MAKMYTPAMAKLDKKRSRSRSAQRPSSPAREAWIRLKRNRLAVVGMVILAILILTAIFADVIAPYGIDEQNYTDALQGPSLHHLFGTDNYGRDIFSRVVYGTRISLPIGLICVFIAYLFGGVLGALAAFYGGKADMIIMRILDIFQSIPPMLMAIAIAASLGTGVVNLVIAISVSTMPARARIVRAAILSVKNSDYVESARCIGAGSRRQLLKYMLPNALGPILTNITFSIATAILTVSSMSYLGLGIAAPTPEWGSMLSAGRSFIRTAPHILIFPGAAIMITVLALNLFGDGLRDALDPRLK
ncbi:MAG: ABC transporter permease [Blautia sp.]|nr:ABC transporter permease [Blautia sp.]